MSAALLVTAFVRVYCRPVGLEHAQETTLSPSYEFVCSVLVWNRSQVPDVQGKLRLSRSAVRHRTHELDLEFDLKSVLPELTWHPGVQT